MQKHTRLFGAVEIRHLYLILHNIVQQNHSEILKSCFEIGPRVKIPEILFLQTISSDVVLASSRSSIYITQWLEIRTTWHILSYGNYEYRQRNPKHTLVVLFEFPD
jgi:hypothetical protein